MLSRFLQFWAGFVYRHYRLVLVVALALTLWTGYFLVQLDFRTDMMALLPQDLPAVRHLLEARDDFGADLTLLVVQRTDEGPVLDYSDVVEDLADLIEESPLVADVEYNIIRNLPFRAILRHFPALMDPGQIGSLAERFSGEAIREQVRKDKLSLISIPTPAVQEMIQTDPLDLFSLFRGRFSRWGGSDRLATTEGYFVNRDGDCLLALIRPTQSSDDIDYDEALLEELRDIRDAVLADFIEEEELEAGLLDIGFTGPHIIAAIDSRIIRREMLRAVAISLIGVLILFAVAFKRIGSFIYIGTPLVAAGCWTMGFCYLFTGSVSLLGGAILAIMIGLGVDFAIHIFSRFLDNRAEGNEALESLSIAMGETGRSVFTGAITTALAFFAMSLYHFKGIREFGIITGTGIICCMISMFTVLPALLTLRSKFVRQYHRKKLFTFGTEYLCRWIQRHYRPVLVFFLLMTVFLFYQALNLEVEDGFTDSRVKINPASALMSEVQQQFGVNFQPVLLVLEGRDLDEAEALALEADRLLAPLVESGHLKLYDSIHSYLPHHGVQEANIGQLEILLPEIRPAAMERAFLEALESNDFNVESFGTYASDVREALEDPRILTVTHVLRMDELLRYFFRYVSFKGDGSIRLAYYLYPSRRPPSAETLAHLEDIAFTLGAGTGDDAAALGSGAGGDAVHLAGIPILTRELKRLTRSGYATVSLVALALVMGLLTIHFRRPGRALLVLTPLLLAVIWLTGIMSLFDFKLNIMNVAVTPMILGIGIDYAVYAMHLYFKNRGTSLDLVFRTSGKALVLSTMTTTVGFGSLVAAEHPGLSTMGGLATLGVILCLLATIGFMPAFITLRERILDR